MYTGVVVLCAALLPIISCIPSTNVHHATRVVKRQAAVPLELVSIGNQQYYFSNIGNKLNWEDARQFCKTNGMELSTIDSEQENQQVLKQAQRLYVRKNWGIWLGASDTGSESNWVWESSQNTLTYTNFDAEQPGGGPTENCLLMHRSDGRWNDFDCNREFMFACKKTNSAAQTQTPDLDKIHFEPELELVKLGQHQFYFSNRENKLNWSFAREFCTSHNLEFASITNARENGLVVAHAQKLYERRLWGLWIGASDTLGEGNWMWDTKKQPIKYHNWDADQPSGGPTENCLLVHRSDGGWNDFDCNREFNFICKKSSAETINLSAAPTVPLVDLGEFQYYFSPKEKRLSWSDAKLFCQDNGLQLTSIETALQNKQIHDHFKTIHRTYSPWIGGSDADEEGLWKWDATQQRLVKFLNWWTYQPDGGITENCLYMFADDGKWGDRKCEYTKPFICQKYE